MLPVVSLDHRILREEAFHQVLQTRVPNAKELCLLLSLGPYAEALRFNTAIQDGRGGSGLCADTAGKLPLRCRSSAPSPRPTLELHKAAWPTACQGERVLQGASLPLSILSLKNTAFLCSEQILVSFNRLIWDQSGEPSSRTDSERSVTLLMCN